MKYFDPYSSYPDRSITAAWDSQLAEAAQTPWFKEILLRRGSELFPRFAARYAELRGLPRSARRALQRQIARSSGLSAIFPDWLQSGGGRALQYKLARSLAGAALLLALGQGVATAATITVTTKDSRIRPDGQCSLIEAMVNANADAAMFPDCEAGSGADTIVLPAKANVRLRDVYADTYGPTGLPLITSPITIQGNGARIRGQGEEPAFRLIAVSNSGELTLQNVTLSGGSSSNGGGLFNNGTLTIQNSSISGNTASWGGGVSNHGSLTIENSAISGNKNGGGVSNGGFVSIANSTISQSTFKTGPFCFYFYGYFNYPGGIYCYYVYSGDLTITNSTISKNSSAFIGGGVSNRYGTVTIANSTISGNKASAGGGAFNDGGSFDYYGKYIPAGDLSIVDSTISKNSAYQGGGLFNRGTFTIENSTISGNKASDDGGGIFNASNYNAPAGDLSLVDTTISQNRAKDSGGGLVNYGSLNTSNSVITGNKARIGAEVFP